MTLLSYADTVLSHGHHVLFLCNFGQCLALLVGYQLHSSLEVLLLFKKTQIKIHIYIYIYILLIMLGLYSPTEDHNSVFETAQRWLLF